MKGKPLNVMNAPIEQIANNQELNDLKKMLGLQEGLDYRYPDNYQTLRYGSFVIMADADVDGKHIIGLILNFFHCRFPSLLAIGFVKLWRTRLIMATKGRDTQIFYSQHEYEEWTSEVGEAEAKKWTLEYFKGLGTSDDEQIAHDFRSPKFVNTIYDGQAPYALQLAFNQKYADPRKEWIANWTPDYSVEKMMEQPISLFMCHEFIQFSIDDLLRSIPNFMDGLKVSQKSPVGLYEEMGW